jgi:hypothetical protein
MLLAASDWLLAKRLRMKVFALRRIQNRRFKLANWMRLFPLHVNPGYKYSAPLELLQRGQLISDAEQLLPDFIFSFAFFWHLMTGISLRIDVFNLRRIQLFRFQLG